MPNIMPIVALLIGGLISLAVYLYSNRIGHKVITISGVLDEDNGEITMQSRPYRLYAERLEMKNFGLRALENVELHLTAWSKPAALSVASASSLSVSGIAVAWEKEIVKISIPLFPRGEEIRIDLIRTGYSEGTTHRLRGTGGRYKIVDLETHKIKKDLMVYVILAFIAFAPPIVLSLLAKPAAEVQLGAPAIRNAN